MLGNSLIASLAIIATSCTLPNEKPNDSDLNGMTSSGPLPISGVWQGVGLLGFKEESSGQVVPIQAGRSDLAGEACRVNLKVDALGNGTMRGMTLCRADPKKLTGSTSILTGGGALLLANGLFGGISLIAEIATMSRCVRSQTGFIETIIPLARATDFFGHARRSLDRNIGYAGMSPSLHAAENDCKSLRGVRFVSIQNSSACVGFSDAYAKRLKFIIIPTGKIRAVRVDFEKVQ